MNTRKLLLPLFAALFGLAASAYAQTVTTEATVAKVTGAATVTMPDGSTTALTPGMKVPQGATIKTGADGDVYIESHAGYITSIKKDSEVAVAELSVTTEGGKVKEEKTLLDLKSGNLVAKLDPSKKAVNNYQVRTPKGVAAARGTVFTVQYKGGTYAIAVVNGVVTVTPPRSESIRLIEREGAGRTGEGVQVNAGQLLLTSGGNAIADSRERAPYKTEQLSNLANNTNVSTGVDVRELLAVAVATVTVAAQNNIGGTTAAEAAQVAQAVFTAVPGAAEQAGALIKASNNANPPADPAAAAAVIQAVTTATPAAAQGAFTSGATTGTFTPNTNTTATSTPNAPVTAPQPIDPSTVSRSN